MRAPTFFSLALASITLLAPAPGLFSATYYVATNGDDLRNPGTQGNPWRTIQKAATALQPGDTVLIRGGLYTEAVVPLRSGEGNYITYMNYGNEDVVIDGQNGARDYCIRVNGKNYLRFVGLRLTGAAKSGLGSGFYAGDNSHHLILDNITSDGNRFGILLFGRVSPVSYITIQNCRLTGNSAHGVFLYEKVYDVDIGPNNQIYSNIGERYAFGIEVGTVYPGLRTNGARRIRIFDNEIHSNGMQGIRTWNAAGVLIRNNHLHHNAATGIQIENGSQDIIVEGNSSEYNAQSYEYETGIWVDGSENVVVRNNMLRKNKIGLLISDSRRVIVRGNVIVENDRGVPHLYNAMGLNIDGNSSDVAVVHNTMFRNGAAQSQRAGLSLCAYNQQVVRAAVKNNIISDTVAPRDLWVGCREYYSDFNLLFNPRGVVVWWIDRNMGWVEYRNQSAQDEHTIVQQPNFASAESGDFRLRQGSAGIDAGGFLARTAGSGEGSVIRVDDACWFTDGFGVTDGDFIRIGPSDPVKVIKVDYATNTISIDRRISWNTGDAVSFPYGGSSPDMGAYEYGGVLAPPSGLRAIP